MDVHKRLQVNVRIKAENNRLVVHGNIQTKMAAGGRDMVRQWNLHWAMLRPSCSELLQKRTTPTVSFGFFPGEEPLHITLVKGAE